MHEAPARQPNTMVEITLDPPQAAVRKLGSAILDQFDIDLEEALSRIEFNTYTLLAESDPPLSRKEVVSRLGLTTLSELSDIENGIFTRLGRRLSDPARESEEFKKLTEARKHEHAHLTTKHAAEKQKDKPDQNNKSTDTDTVSHPEPDSSPEAPKQQKSPPKRVKKSAAKPRERKPQAPAKSVYKPRRRQSVPRPHYTPPVIPAQFLREQVRAERDGQITDLRMTLRRMNTIIANREKDASHYLTPTQFKVYVACCNELATNQQIQTGVRCTQTVLQAKITRIITKLTERMPDSFAFPMPKSPRNESLRKTQAVEARLQREQLDTAQNNQLTDLRVTIRDMDALLVRRHQDASLYLTNLQHTAYMAFRDGLKTNQQIQAEFRASPLTLLRKVRRLISRLMCKAAVHVAFPVPPAVDKIRAPVLLDAKPVSTSVEPEPDLRTMHYTQYIKATAKRHYEEGVKALVQDLSDMRGVHPNVVRKFLSSETHPPLDEFMTPLQQILDIGDENYAIVKQQYMQMRLIKVMRHLKIPVGEPAAETTPGEQQTSALLHQLDTALRQHGTDIRTAIPAHLVDVCDILYGDSQSWEFISKTYGISIKDIATLESRLIARAIDGLPPHLANHHDIRPLIRPHRIARTGSWRPKSPSSLPSHHSSESWTEENQLRTAISEVTDQLVKAGYDPVEALRNASGPTKYLTDTYSLLNAPNHMVDIFHALKIRRNELTKVIKRIHRTLAATLPENTQPATVETEAEIAPGEFLSGLRQQLKTTRGDDVSVARLANVTGASTSAIQKFFRGTSHPDVERILVPIARHLGTDEAVLSQLIAEEKKLQHIQNERAQAGRKRPRY